MRILTLAVPLALLACHHPTTAPLERDLLQAAAEYVQYGRVDDETRWAPYLCRAPRPSHGRLSDAAAGSSHGRKLYYVWARHREDYVRAGARQPVGQVVVKEAWEPDEVPGMSPADLLRGYVPYAVRDGKVYKAGRRAGLFLMMKTAAPATETDEGWVYATTSADGRSLTSSGRVSSCMRCHQDAPSDRLFGLK